MKKKPSNLLTPAEMRDIGWRNRTAESRAAHLSAMGKACNAKMSEDAKRERARLGGLAKAANKAARELAESQKKAEPPKQRKTPKK